LSKASKVINPSYCLDDEVEYGEAWVTEFLRSCFCWILPDDEGEVDRDAVEAKGEPFGESREFEEARSFEVGLILGARPRNSFAPCRPLSTYEQLKGFCDNSPVSMHFASCTKRYSLSDKGEFGVDSRQRPVTRWALSKSLPSLRHTPRVGKIGAGCTR